MYSREICISRIPGNVQAEVRIMWLVLINVSKQACATRGYSRPDASMRIR